MTVGADSIRPPCVSTKRITSKQAGISLWQKGFYDHVIRNDEDLANVRQYIRNNPLKWIQDKD